MISIIYERARQEELKMSKLETQIKDLIKDFELKDELSDIIFLGRHGNIRRLVIGDEYNGHNDNR